MAKLTLKNDFHDTEVTLKITLAEIKEGATFELSPNQVKRAHRELCGTGDCCCSGHTGARAPWHKIDGKEVQLELLQGQRDCYNTPVSTKVYITKINEKQN